MSKILIIGAGTMGAAFSIPCLDNNHDVNIVGTHLEDNFIDELKKNDNCHPSLRIKIPKAINLFKSNDLKNISKSKLDLIVLAISSKGITWSAEQLSLLASNDDLPPILLLTKGLNIFQNNFEILANKLKRLLKEKGIEKVSISAIGGPCLAAGLANKINTNVVVVNENISIARDISILFKTNYYHLAFSDDMIGVETCAAIKNIYAIAIGASKGVCGVKLSKNSIDNNHLNTAAALVKQSISEMIFFIEKIKGKKETVLGLAGIGDLYVSADGGRNSKMGSHLGDGLTYSDAKKTKMKNTTVEGADLIFQIGKKVKEDFSDKQLPLMIATINSILDDKKLEINWKNFY